MKFINSLGNIFLKLTPKENEIVKEKLGLHNRFDEMEIGEIVVVPKNKLDTDKNSTFFTKELLDEIIKLNL